MKTSLLIPDLHISPHPAIAQAAEQLGYSVSTTDPPPQVAPRPIKEPLNSALTSFNSGQMAQAAIAGTDYHLAMLFNATRGHDIVVCAPPEPTFVQLASKTRSRFLYENCGFPLAEGVIIRFPSFDLPEHSKLDFPLIAKFPVSCASSGVSVIHDEPELRRKIVIAKAAGVDLVIEAFLGPTREFSHQFFVIDRHWLPAYSLCKLSHMAPSFSTSIKLLSIPNERALFEPLSQCFGRLPDGYYSAQFKDTKNDGLKLIEINCRLGNNFRIVHRMLPQLGAAVLTFYLNRRAWVALYAKMRSQVREAWGVSPVEELVGRVRRVARSDASARTLLDELLWTLRLMLHVPTVDFYFANLLRRPSMCIEYYRSALAESPTLRSRRHNALRMVPR
jgi:hypothetical protein